MRSRTTGRHGRPPAEARRKVVYAPASEMPDDPAASHSPQSRSAERTTEGPSGFAADGSTDRFDPHRVAAFSDGVMAIAITLLILDLRLPSTIARTDAALQAQLRALEAPFVAFVLSFAVIAVWWNSHHRLFAVLVRGDRRILALNMAFLAAVVFLPFPTSVLGRYTTLPTALVLYAGTNVVIGSAALLMWWHAERAGLLAGDLDPAELRRLMGYAATAPLVFLISIPIALVDPSLAAWSWNGVWILVVALRIRWRPRAIHW